MRGCVRTVTMFLLALVVALAVALSVIYFQQQGVFNFFSPTYNNRATIVLRSVQQMSLLTTTRHNFTSMVTSEREMPGALAFLYGERQVLVAVGHVTAGIDLSQIDADDVSIEGATLTIVLPPPALQDCFLNEGASYIAERDTGIFTASAPNLDTEARRFAVQQFRDTALSEGILDEVQMQAQVAISSFVDALDIAGVETVILQTTPPDAGAPLPPSCG